jgi:RimJ/RimL family protein N-acetyltransferase
VTRTLPDGTPYAIRAIGPADQAGLAALMTRFSPDTIRRRFLATKPRLSSAELRYLTHVDQRHHVALVAVPADDPTQLLGVARCVRVEPGSDVADFAIAVADALQGHGIGTALAGELSAAARAVGIDHFTATTLADNVASYRLMRGFAARLHERGISGGVRELVLDLAA